MAYKKVVLATKRVLYPKLYVAEEFMGNKRFSSTVLLTEEDEKALEAQIKACIEEDAPGKGDQLIKRYKGSRQSWPIKETDDGFSITPKRKEEKGAPLVLDQQKQNIPADAGLPYCWCNVSITIFHYTKNGGGVTLYLNGVQLVRTDAPLAGGSAPSRDDFEVISEDDVPQADADMF